MEWLFTIVKGYDIMKYIKVSDYTEKGTYLNRAKTKIALKEQITDGNKG